MAKLNLDPAYFRAPGTKKLMRLLGEQAIALPLQLDCYAHDQFPIDGVFTGMDAGDIADAVDWKGDPEKMIEALIATGHVERVGENLARKNWAEDQGHIAAFKERAQTAAKSRWEKARGKEKPPKSDATSMPQAMLGTPLSNAPSSSLPSCISLPAFHTQSNPSSPAAPAEQDNPAAVAATDAADGSRDQFGEEKKRQDGVDAELEACGIDSIARKKLINIAGVMPAHVRLLRFQAKENSRLTNKPGWIISQIREGACAGIKITPLIARNMIWERQIVSVCGEFITNPGDTDCSGQGLQIVTAAGPKLISPDRLTLSTIKFTPLAPSNSAGKAATA